jgi:hypothetical protein
VNINQSTREATDKVEYPNSERATESAIHPHYAFGPKIQSKRHVSYPYTCIGKGVRLTLRGILDLEALLQALARGRLVAAGRLEAVDGIDTTLRGAFVVLEVQPLDGALGVGAGARRHRRVRLTQLADQCHGVRGSELVEREDGGGAREEVVADHVLEAERGEILSELGRLRHQGECQWGNGGDGPFGEGAGV